MSVGVLRFNQNHGSAIITTLDKIQDDETHDYTWQLNLGNEANDGDIAMI